MRGSTAVLPLLMACRGNIIFLLAQGSLIETMQLLLVLLSSIMLLLLSRYATAIVLRSLSSSALWGRLWLSSRVPISSVVRRQGFRCL